MEPMVNVALRAAWDAENLINRMIDRPDLLKVSPGKSRTHVTNLERSVEEAILSSLRQAHPRHGYFTPESGLMQGDAEESEFVWFIDPLCGSDNLLRGIPHFSFSIACQHRGRTEHAVIVDPIRRERFTASRGKGAQLNDSRIRVSGRSHLDEAVLALAGENPAEEPAMRLHAELARRVRLEGARLRESGCASLDLAYIAAGRIDGGWMVGLSPTELIAGAMLIAEAGGLVSDFDGTPEWERSGNLVGASPKCLKPLLQLVHDSA